MCSDVRAPHLHLGETAESLGDLLRRLRLERGLTQELLAERAEMSVRGLQKVERGETRPYRETLERLMIALEIDPQMAETLRVLGRGHPRRSEEGEDAQGGVAPVTLPRPLTGLIGRTSEMADLKRLLGDSRLVTVTGPAGIGKTHLTLQVAWDVAPQYADGVWWVDLGTVVSPATVLQAVAETLHLAERPPLALTETVHAALEDAHALLCLDSCEREIQECARLVDDLLRTCPALTIVVTSREPLLVAGEVLFRLLPLGYPSSEEDYPVEQLLGFAAVRLFVERASAIDPTFALNDESARYVVQICERLDGVPLALELAAGCVSAISVGQLAERLHERFALLTGGNRSAPLRHQTLRAAIDWSYDLLDEIQRLLLNRLSVFSSGWDLDAAEAICSGGGLEQPAIVRILIQLVTRSLVMADSRQSLVKRYYLLETVRLYALQQLRAQGEETIFRQRHAEYFLAFAQQGGALEPDPAKRQQRNDALEREEGNLRTALQWFSEQSGPKELVTLVNALTPYWHARNRYSEAHEWLGRVLALSELSTLPHDHVRALYNAGTIALAEGDHRRAWDLLMRSVNLARNLEDPRDLALALGSAAEVATHNREREAEPLLTESLQIYQQVGDRLGEAKRLGQLGVLKAYAGELDRAETLLRDSVVRSQEAGDAVGVAHATAGLGLIATCLGDWDVAQARYEEALKLYRERRNRRGEGYTLCALAQIALHRRQLNSAGRLLLESLEIARDLNLRDLEAWTLLNLGRLARERKLYREAHQRLASCLSLRLAQGHEWGAAVALAELAETEIREGKPRRAVPLLAAAERRLTAPDLLPTTSDPSGYSLDRIQRHLEDLRQQLGEEEWCSAWALGHTLEDRDLMGSSVF
ncbi:MAG: tetratricopeptide repeat protein [Chloroflexi bacterium]|nr:tetratricopeptide repeat protein [Chloroflexota bacterium]